MSLPDLPSLVERYHEGIGAVLQEANEKFSELADFQARAIRENAIYCTAHRDRTVELLAKDRKLKRIVWGAAAHQSLYELILLLLDNQLLIDPTRAFVEERLSTMTPKAMPATPFDGTNSGTVTT